MEIDIEFLISLVAEHPVIWDKALEEYRSRNSTMAAWKEVCAELYPDFETLRDKDKNDFERYVTKKWTNVKDSWMKSQRRMMEKTLPGCKPGKKYVYQEQLAFLKKNLTPNEPLSCYMPSSTENLDSDSNPPDDSYTSLPEEIDVTIPVKSKRPKMEPFEQRVFDSMDAPENRHLNFFKGIMPSLESLNEDQVIQFQRGVLEVLLQGEDEGGYTFIRVPVCGWMGEYVRDLCNEAR